MQVDTSLRFPELLNISSVASLGLQRYSHKQSGWYTVCTDRLSPVIAKAVSLSQSIQI